MTTVLSDVRSSQVALEQSIALANLQVDSRAGDEIRVDFSCVIMLQSETLGQLVRLHLKAHRCDARLVLENVDPRVLEILALTRLDRMLQIRTDPDHLLIPNPHTESKSKRLR